MVPPDPDQSDLTNQKSRTSTVSPGGGGGCPGFQFGCGGGGGGAPRLRTVVFAEELA